MATTESSKAKVKEKCARLKQELERTMSDFAKEKKELETAYQQQADDMFFYDYQCCMKKPDIISSNEKDEVELDDGVEQGDDLRMGDEFAVIDHED